MSEDNSYHPSNGAGAICFCGGNGRHDGLVHDRMAMWDEASLPIILRHVGLRTPSADKTSRHCQMAKMGALWELACIVPIEESLLLYLSLSVGWLDLTISARSDDSARGAFWLPPCGARGGQIKKHAGAPDRQLQPASFQ